MTCVVGLVARGRVYMGADSASVESDGSIRAVVNRKVFVNGDVLMGSAGSWAQISDLHHRFDAPDVGAADPDGYMVHVFVPAARRVIGKTCDPFLVGVGGRLFLVDSDWHVEEPALGMAAVGSGAAWGIAALLTSRRAPTARVTDALVAAEQFCSGVRGPFYQGVI